MLTVVPTLLGCKSPFRPAAWTLRAAIVTKDMVKLTTESHRLRFMLLFPPVYEGTQVLSRLRFRQSVVLSRSPTPAALHFLSLALNPSEVTPNPRATTVISAFLLLPSYPPR